MRETMLEHLARIVAQRDALIAAGRGVLDANNLDEDVGARLVLRRLLAKLALEASVIAQTA